MPSKQVVILDARQIAKEHITITVQIKKMWMVRLGLLFIKFGCWISGASYVNEFPMSLIQDDKPVEMDK